MTKSKYALLGRLLMNEMPKVAESLLVNYKEMERENDFSKIDALFEKFCAFKQIHPAHYKGPLYKSHKIEVRREFVAIILHLYDPESLKSNGDIQIRTGVVGHLSKVTMQPKSKVSEMIREVITMLHVYDDFNNRVNFLLKKLQINNNGNN